MINKVNEKLYRYKNYELQVGEGKLTITKGSKEYVMWCDDDYSIEENEAELVGFMEVKFDEFVEHMESKSSEVLSSNVREVHFRQCEDCTFRDEDYMKTCCQVFDIKPNELDGIAKCTFYLKGDYDRATDLRYQDAD